MNNTIFKINNILINAIEKRATDIHLTNTKDNLEIVYRIKGRLHKIEDIKENIDEIISRIKLIAKMNITEKRIPQDGKYIFSYNNRKYDMRLATLPIKYGESISIRILNNLDGDINLLNLGFNKEEIAKIDSILNKKYGLILISGATGSGKTTTLFSMINRIDKKERRIISVEDPIENEIDDILQVQINEKINLNFNDVLRSALRMDPDILIISEIRDEETVNTAIRASLTGHLVISTIHSSDIYSTINRIIEMKVKKYLLLDSLLGIIYQELDYDKIFDNLILKKDILIMDDYIREIISSTDDKFLVKQKLKNYIIENK